MRELQTASGKMYEIAFCIPTTFGTLPVVYIEFIHQNIPDIVAVFAEPIETQTLTSYIDGEMQRRMVGYTTLNEVYVTDNGNIKIRLDATINPV